MSENQRKPKQGVEVIRSALKHMGAKPGVYQMIGAGEKILYIGKAKSLKNRVTNYTQLNRLVPRIARMVSQVQEVRTVVVETETDALLLEASLIRQHKPKFNILLKDDKSFPYIMVDKQSKHAYPRISKHRGKKTDKAYYFGPFPSAGAVNQAIMELQKVFLLRGCTDSMFASRKRPCLEYQIKRCSAPCVNYISEADYGHAVQQARQFLSGKSQSVQDDLQAQMEQASQEMEYEKAASLRDRIQALHTIQSRKVIRDSNLPEADVVALVRDGNIACVKVLFIRNGKMLGDKSYFLNAAVEESADDIIEAFLGQFYQGQPVPALVVVNTDFYSRAMMAEALSEMREGKKCIIEVPQRGDKRHLIELGEVNAKHELEKRAQERMNTDAILKEVGKIFEIKQPIKRIDVFDNSHLFGKHAVGGMIVAGEDGFIKNEYRKFNVDAGIKTTGGDDYGMLRQVLERRYGKLQENNPGREDKEGYWWPDLVLIDGGQGHLSVAIEVFERLGIKNLTFVCIAKGPDRNAGREFYYLPNQDAFQLEFGSAVAHYMQRLRDEAHRYAIGAYRKKHEKSLGQSELDEIPGLGAARKRALLHRFGSFSAVKGASLSDIASVKGISESLAKRILDYIS